jgi:hypothetical protein
MMVMKIKLTTMVMQSAIKRYILWVVSARKESMKVVNAVIMKIFAMIL